MYFDGPVPESIARRIARGDLTRINPDGTPWDSAGAVAAEQPEPQPEPEDEGEDEGDPAGAPPLPGARDSKAAWAEAAVSRGTDPAQADSMTKAQLIEALTVREPDA
jgi:hypothetical protein